MKNRSEKKELLDGEGIPVEDLFLNLKELDTINRLLGGHAITLAGFKHCRQQIPNNREIHVVELGSGGGDNLRVLANYARREGIAARFTGIDLKTACVAYAQKQLQDYPEIQFIQDDYLNYQPEETADIAFSSLFCHHLNEAQIQQYLQWNQQYARRFFINDLHRHPLAKGSIGLLTQLFSKSYLVKHDAPLSVARGFVKSDWQKALADSGLHRSQIHWRWAFRWLIEGEGAKA